MPGLAEQLDPKQPLYRKRQCRLSITHNFCAPIEDLREKREVAKTDRCSGGCAGGWVVVVVLCRGTGCSGGCA